MPGPSLPLTLPRHIFQPLPLSSTQIPQLEAPPLAWGCHKGPLVAMACDFMAERGGFLVEKERASAPHPAGRGPHKFGRTLLGGKRPFPMFPHMKLAGGLARLAQPHHFFPPPTGEDGFKPNQAGPPIPCKQGEGPLMPSSPQGEH